MATQGKCLLHNRGYEMIDAGCRNVGRAVASCPTGSAGPALMLAMMIIAQLSVYVQLLSVNSCIKGDCCNGICQYCCLPVGVGDGDSDGVGDGDGDSDW